MATKETTPNKNVGDYSEPGIHPGDETNAAGQKSKFDRGDPDEPKEDIIQGKAKKPFKNAETPVEYSETGIHDGDEIDASGHKKKFDRAAPEENQAAFNKLQDSKPVAETTEVAKPNYVAVEAQRQKEALQQGTVGHSEKEFLEHLISKASAGGWNSPIIDEMKHRVETLG